MSVYLVLLFLVAVSVSNAQITASQFSCMFPRVPPSRVQSYIPSLNSALSQFNINTLARVQMFLAQTGHETDNYNTFTEYTNKDGTNAYCPRYDGGCTFKGRGAIQLTHKYNYVRAGNELGVDFVSNPNIVATPQYAFQVAGLYWKWRNLNKCSDERNLDSCTRLINGGTNGLADRRTKYSSAQQCITSLGGQQSQSQGQSQDQRFPSQQAPVISGPSCTANGQSGQCIDVNQRVCSGTVYRGLCSGPSNIRCCVGGASAIEGDSASYSQDSQPQLAAATIGVVVVCVVVSVVAIVVLIVILVRRHQAAQDSNRP